MTVNYSFSEGADKLMLSNDLGGLNSVYKELADEIGLENTLVVYNMFHGMQVTFPNRLFSKEYIHSRIICEYNGDNVSQLAQKYNYSERSIWRILKSRD